jgi:cyclomaltodextrinase / maltogenic alpha-amylase / neopullulanase
MTVPDWVKDAVFYQIFPDRFANGNPANDPPNVSSWNAPPTRWSFHGGDLKGISDHMDYLVDLGINAIYLNPIFQSPSNHRYNAIDYFKIDPRLGRLDDFHTLIAAAHRNGIRVILDGVFNHCGRGFFAFSDILENGVHSSYRDWFHVHHFPIDAYSHGEARDYEAWWGIKSLPKLNTGNPEVRRYVFQVARYWIEQGADGWRLDVPNEIDDDAFWDEFRLIVRAAKPDAYLLGEIWEALPRWVGERTFDGLMNYPLRTALIDFLNAKITAAQFGKQVKFLCDCYPAENLFSMYNLIGSHDTERALTMLDDDIRRLRSALLFQFVFPGVPAVYYGDEIGLQGGKDPDCRRAFPWDIKSWDQDLRSYVKTLIQLRHEKAVLRRGNFEEVLMDDAHLCYVSARVLDDEKILVALSGSSQDQVIDVPVARLGFEDGRELKNLLGKETFHVSGDQLRVEIPAYAGLLLE